MRLSDYLPLLLGVICTSTVFAHELWLEREDGAYLLYQGHRHSAHAGEERVPYAQDFVQQAVCAQSDGSKQLMVPPATYPARFQAACAALLIEASSGVWTKTVHGTQHQPPTGLSGVVHSWRSTESVKRLDAWSEALREPLGKALELAPIKDPFRLQPGDKLRLLVTFRGEPKAGVNLAYDGVTRGVTGDDGRINLRIRHAGWQMITGSFSQPDTDPDVDQVVHSAVLHFQLDGSAAPE